VRELVDTAKGETRGCQRHPLNPRGRCAARGFSLVDVLVTMAVAAVLISLLTPTLSSVRETAHQVVCRSSVRQFGLGIHMYAEDHDGHIPKSINATAAGTEFRPWETNTLRFGSDRAQFAHQWDGLGRLYEEDYLVAARLFYCPSHRGNYPYRSYEERWGGQVGTIVGNFQYRGRGAAPSRGTTILASMSPSTALVSDGLRFQSDFNHKVGANILRAGLSVAWFSDPSGSVADLLPKDGEPVLLQIENVWNTLDDF
jgi:competence protein ComGC